MKKVKKKAGTYITIAALTAVCMTALTACTDDGGSSKAMATWQLTMAASEFCEDNTHAAAPVAMPTRSFTIGGSTWTDIAELEAPQNMSGTGIRCFLTRNRRVDFSGNFLFNGTGWTSRIPTDADTYDIYGYTPAKYSDRTVMHPADNDYADGAMIVMSNMPAITTDDPCVTVAVKRSTTATTPIANAGMQLGSFVYRAEEGDNYVLLLMDHVYASLKLRMKVDRQYNTVRTIHLRSISIVPVAASGEETVATATVTALLTANETGNSPLTVSSSYQTGTPAAATLFEGDMTLKDDSQADYWSTFSVQTVPGANKRFRLTCRYDVYDKTGRLTRGEQTVSNTIALNNEHLTAGQQHTISVTVNPTFLHVLSDDLDNPTITID